MTEIDAKAVGARIKAVRDALRMDQTQFGLKAGLSAQALHEYERGSRLIEPRKAASLVHAYNVTLDYLYLGVMRGIPFGLREPIVARMQRDSIPYQASP